jgi:hypothetical protein
MAWLSGWSYCKPHNLTGDDILAFNVDSVATVTRVTLSIRAEKS